MKKSIFLLVLSFFTSLSFSQIEDGRFEISASGTFGSFSFVYKSNSYTDENEGRLYLNTSIKAGYIFFEGIEIEPELYTSIVEKDKPSFLISSNLVYNYYATKTRIYPFILAGYGIGNSYPFITTSNAFIRMSDEFDVGCFNAGIGLKYYLNDNVGIRAEYRYQRYNDKSEERWNNNIYNNKIILNIHSMLFGFSILF